jgi:cation transport regulator ChaC
VIHSLDVLTSIAADYLRGDARRESTTATSAVSSLDGTGAGARRPLWIFGYGSLLFRPGFPYETRLSAIVRGFRRRLDQGSPDHRGTPARLGRVATLIRDPLASSGGAVYRVAERDAEAVLRQLDHREKGGYERIEVDALLLDGSASVRAITWIASPDNPYHLGPADLPQMVAQIRASHGPSGSNVEYVLSLAATLAELGIDDPHITEIARALSWRA